ncbi:CdaR family transcriptional regulator [Conexibacter sp. DBS9H8]|uniref:PucR family transcriptional regulator n=1 Tax=Conexibacter sp. DBS9H8 TaxID=2937801 RepID=UPI00200D8AC0|nr:helix-turn-helix domain-containing protein [Conexibacter sp. DBS9H8]
MVSEGNRATVAETVRVCADGMRDELDGVAAAITERIHAACPDLPAGLTDGTYASTLSNVDAFTTIVRDGIDPGLVPPPEDAQAYACQFARGGLDAELLTRAYRHGEHAYLHLWKGYLQRTAADPDTFAAATIHVNDLLFQYISSVTRALALQHAAEQERRSSPAATLRLAEVRRLLSGAPVDQLRASQRLRYRLDGWHTAFVIWEEGEACLTEESLGTLAPLADATGRALGATNTLTLELGDVYAGWANVCASAVDAPRDRPGGVHVTFGLSHRGPEGFRRSHEEALQARRVYRLGGRCGTPVSFGELALEALLTHDLKEARRFVERELGDLADGTGPRRRIVETLEAYLTAGSSLARVSRQLGVHENTVAYRIRRAEEILGRRIDEHQLELQAALRLARILPADPP